MKLHGSAFNDKDDEVFMEDVGEGAGDDRYEEGGVRWCRRVASNHVVRSRWRGPVAVPLVDERRDLLVERLS